MTYTVMLVEDEPPILYAMKHLIESGNYGFTVIATAQNGRDALKALDEHAPDVIITDIQMPFMNGLDLIDEVHRRQPEIKSIILTGYSDFEYSRKALRSNAYEYLLKPIQIEQLRAVLESLRETLNKCRIQAEQSTLNNAIFFEQYAKLDLPNLSNRFLVPLIICAGHYAHENWYIDHTGREFWEKIENLNGIQTHTDNCNIWILNGFTTNERIVILGLDSLDHSSIVHEFAIKLMQKLSKGEIPIQMIYGESVSKVNGLSNEIKKLRMAITQKIVFGASGIFGAVKRSKVPFITPSNYENRFALMAQHKNLDLFKKDFLPLLKEWESKKYVQAWIETLLLSLTNKLAQVHHAELGKLSQSSLVVSEVLSISPSYTELFENYCRFIRVIYENADKITDISAAEIVTHMEEYFQNNFTSAISYKMFYDLFGFNETYLSHVFKQQRGITPNKYVSKLRIERAKEMILLQPDAPLKKIAVQVGYDDAFYFSRVFKGMTGIRPSDFIKHSKDQTKL